ncbi:MAG: hypothetical protein WCP89_02900, partial [archaeon]
YGFIVGILSIVISDLLKGSALQLEVSTLAVGWTTVIILPIFYAGICFIIGIISAIIYNLLSGFLGGIKVEFEEIIREKNILEEKLEKV